MAMSLFSLFCVFFYIGLFAIGGGLVAATFMQQVLVTKYGLITTEKFFSMLAISESTPGPIGINMATYIGNEMYGPVGGIVTTIGEVLPSLIIIILIARFFSQLEKKPVVQCAFSGLRPATSGMIMVAMAQVYKIALLNLDKFSETKQFLDLFPWSSLVFFAICLVLLFKTKLQPVFLVLLGAVFGVLFL